MAKILYSLPSNWVFPSKCTILSDNFNPIFKRPTLYLGGHKEQIEPISTSLSVLTPTPLDKLKFTKWFTNDLCTSQGYFKITLPVFGLEKEFLAKSVGGFKENFSNMTMDFEIEIYDKYVLDDSVLENLRPVITMLGTNPIVVFRDEPYTDAGATARDYKNEDITDSIVTINNVDTGTAGTYNVTYNVTDVDGYEAHEKVRNVTIEIRANVIKYIRFWQNGNTVNTGNYIVEAQALDSDGNVITGDAYWEDVDGTQSRDVKITDGDKDTANYVQIANRNGTRIALHLDFDAEKSASKIKLWRYYDDGRKFHETQIEVSRDGVNWVTLQDSTVTGEYAETADGLTLIYDEETNKWQ